MGNPIIDLADGRHSIIYMDELGNENIFRGGPGGPTSGRGDFFPPYSGWGPIDVYSGPIASVGATAKL